MVLDLEVKGIEDQSKQMLSIRLHLGIEPLEQSIHLNGIVLGVEALGWWSSFLWLHEFALGIDLWFISLVIKGTENQDIKCTAYILLSEVLKHRGMGADAIKVTAASQSLVCCGRGTETEVNFTDLKHLKS